MKFDTNILWNVALWIFGATIVTQGVSLMYQQAYYIYFGVDFNVLDLLVDPSYLFNSVIILIVIGLALIFFYFYIKILQKLPKNVIKSRVAGDVFIDVIAAILLIFALVAYFFDLIPIQKPLTPLLDDIFLISVAAVSGSNFIAKAVMIFYHMRKQKKKDFKVAYLQASKILNDPPEVLKKLVNRIAPIPIWIPLMLIAGFMVFYFPSQLAEERAKGLKQFTEVVVPYKTADEALLVIGRTGDGLIVKTYDVKVNAFKEGFKIISEQDKEFKPFVIK